MRREQTTLWERSSDSSDELLARLQAWCRRAEEAISPLCRTLRAACEAMRKLVRSTESSRRSNWPRPPCAEPRIAPEMDSSSPNESDAHLSEDQGRPSKSNSCSGPNESRGLTNPSGPFELWPDTGLPSRTRPHRISVCAHRSRARASLPIDAGVLLRTEFPRA